MPKNKVNSASSRSRATEKAPAREHRFVSDFGDQARARKKRQERLVLIFAAAFSLGIITLGWITDGLLFTAPWEAVMALESPGNASRSAAINCRLPGNRNTPYCQNRKAEVRSQWEGIQKGGSKGFNLH